MELVDVSQLIPDAIIDLRYTNERNIAGRPISTLTTPQLVRPAALALVAVADELRSQGYRLVIWDAFQQPAVQQLLQTLQPDPRYVAEESNHCRGCAVDLTLVTGTGTLFDMGTDHDDFSERAHIDFAELTAQQRQNRTILSQAMQTHCFIPWPYEWWHFDYECL